MNKAFLLKGNETGTASLWVGVNFLLSHSCLFDNSLNLSPRGLVFLACPCLSFFIQCSWWGLSAFCLWALSSVSSLCLTPLHPSFALVFYPRTGRIVTLPAIQPLNPTTRFIEGGIEEIYFSLPGEVWSLSSFLKKEGVIIQVKNVGVHKSINKVRICPIKGWGQPPYRSRKSRAKPLRSVLRTRWVDWGIKKSHTTERDASRSSSGTKPPKRWDQIANANSRE